MLLPIFQLDISAATNTKTTPAKLPSHLHNKNDKQAQTHTTGTHTHTHGHRHHLKIKIASTLCANRAGWLLEIVAAAVWHVAIG